MSDYCFIITSTIHSENTCYSSQERFMQTIETIDSIRYKCLEPYIVLVDNSIKELEQDQTKILENKVDSFIKYDHTVASMYYNMITNKGLGEILILERGLKEIEKLSVKPKRIFKISGRYTLNENFDINYYKDASNKFIGAVRTWNFYNNHNEVISQRYSFETALWSFPIDQFENVKNFLLINAFDHLYNNQTDLEHSFFTCIPKELMEIKNPVGVTTNTGHNGEINYY